MQAKDWTNVDKFPALRLHTLQVPMRSESLLSKPTAITIILFRVEKVRLSLQDPLARARLNINPSKADGLAV